MDDANDVDRGFGEFVKDEVVFKSFDGVLAKLFDFGIFKAAVSSDARGFGEELEGGFGSIDKSVACVEIVVADVGGDSLGRGFANARMS
jgi:hypothetical protein